MAAVIGVCTRRCCGWLMRNDLTADLAVDAPGIAATPRKPEPGTMREYKKRLIRQRW